MSRKGLAADPKVDIQVPTSPKLPIRDLERDGHFVVFVEFFVETFSGMGAHLDVVGEGGSHEAGEESASGDQGEEHCGGMGCLRVVEGVDRVGVGGRHEHGRLSCVVFKKLSTSAIP